MDQIRTKVGGGQPVDVGNDGLKVIERQFQRNDRRWSRPIKRLSYISNLRKGRVRIESIETQKPAIPIRKTAQYKKTTAWTRYWSCVWPRRPRGIDCNAP